MTKILIKKNKLNQIISVECDGHTGYGAEGEDIVCAALSSIVQTALLGLVAVVGINPDIRRDDENGYLFFSIPQNLSEKEYEHIDVILRTMFLGITDLREGYSDFIELEVK